MTNKSFLDAAIDIVLEEIGKADLASRFRANGDVVRADKLQTAVAYLDAWLREQRAAATAHLPWILAARELRLGRNLVGKAPREFIWATSNPQGDRTCSAMCKHPNNRTIQGLRSGDLRWVRFTLDPEAHGFFPWREVGERFPEWTPAEIRRFNSQAAVWGQSTADWYCRPAALPIKGLEVHTRTWRDKRWKPLTSSRAAVSPDLDDALGVEIGGDIYMSKKITGPQGHAGYISLRLPSGEYKLETTINRPPIVSLDSEPIMTPIMTRENN